MLRATEARCGRQVKGREVRGTQGQTCQEEMLHRTALISPCYTAFEMSGVAVTRALTQARNDSLLLGSVRDIFTTSALKGHSTCVP